MKRIAATFLAVLMVCTLCLPFTALAEATSGDCENGLHWELSGNTLIISKNRDGSGAMNDYEDWDYAPWYKMYDDVKRVEIRDGVTHIGSYAFYDYYNESVSIGKDVESIGDYAFYNNNYMKDMVILPASVRSVGEEAFAYCTMPKLIVMGVNSWGYEAFSECDALVSLFITEGVETIDNAAFYGCDHLKEVWFPESLKSIGEDVFDGWYTHLTDAYYAGTGSFWDAVSVDPSNSDLLAKACTVHSGDVPYYDEAGVKQQHGGIPLRLAMDWPYLPSGWYVVDSQVECNDRRLQINGNVRLILRDNCGFSSNDIGTSNGGGIHVCDNAVLSIYSESLDYSDYSRMGYIEARNDPCHAAIGSDEDQAAPCTINICGGNISAHTKLSSAAIGSGSCAACCYLNIFGGSFVASCDSHGPAIGGGQMSSCVLTIAGGLFKDVQGGTFCPAIGVGGSGSGDLTILGGEFRDIKAGPNCSVAVGGPSGSTLRILQDTIGITGSRTGSTLSEGSLWIIIGVAAAALIGVSALAIIRKKKSAAASSKAEE